jgi:hypothetical protein
MDRRLTGMFPTMSHGFLQEDYAVLREAVRQCRSWLALYMEPNGISAQDCLDGLVSVLFNSWIEGAFDPRLELRVRPDDDFLLQDFAALHTAVKRARRCMDWLMLALDNEQLGAAGNFEALVANGEQADWDRRNL